MSDALTIVLGGVVLEAKLRDGNTEEVKVRQLPVEFIESWARLQGDHAGLVELYCDRQDKVTAARLRTLRTQELSLLQKINEADPEKFDDLESRLTTLREKIAEVEKVPRWDSKLLPESHNEILRIGEELNRPFFDQWVTEVAAAISRTNTGAQKLKPLASTSDSSQPSAASSSV